MAFGALAITYIFLSFLGFRESRSSPTQPPPFALVGFWGFTEGYLREKMISLSLFSFQRRTDKVTCFIQGACVSGLACSSSLNMALSSSFKFPQTLRNTISCPEYHVCVFLYTHSESSLSVS